MTTAERLAWLTERQKGIGSSDAADIAGRGFAGDLGPDRVYRSKIEPPDPFLPAGGPLRRGIEMEPLAANLYQEIFNVELSLVPLVQHPDHHWMIASNDRTRPDGVKVEIKTLSSFSDQWGEQGTGEVPDGYRIQVQHQLCVTRADYMDLYALEINRYEGRVYRIEADRKLQDWLVGIEGDFWMKHVLTRTPPGDSWLKLLDAEQPPLPIVEDEIDLGPDWSVLCERRKQAVLDRDTADAEVKQINSQILAAMQGHRRALAGRFRIKLVSVAGGPVSYDREPYNRLDIRAK